jgi:hypothetical protein
MRIASTFLMCGMLAMSIGCGTTENAETGGADAENVQDASGSGSGVDGGPIVGDIGGSTDPDTTRPADDTIASDTVAPPASCEGPNPGGCSSDDDCAADSTCEVSVTRECIPSSCSCDEASGDWVCTDDCGEMRCARTRIACRPTGICPDGGECVDGWCDAPPVACPDIEAPVCGEDGETYGNGCEAEAAGVGIAYSGACEREDASCAMDTDCRPGSVCSGGECTELACGRIYAPVCGVDGRTCANACLARVSHVEIADSGECAVDLCALIDCAEGKVCVDGVCVGEVTCDVDCDESDPVCGSNGTTYYCGAAEAECNGVDVDYAGPCIDRDPCATVRCSAGFVCRDGECVEDTCTIACLIADPVCGTNGVTYTCGEVEAECYGVDVAYDGACDPNPERCEAADDCEVGSLCFSGACEVAICPAVYRPVCGTDGRTYGNSCEAEAAHVRVASDGACDTMD